MREPKNTFVQIFPSAARTATVNSSDRRNARHSGVRLHVDVTAITSSPSIVVKIQGKDAITGDYRDILSSAAITATGDTYMEVWPGATAATNAAVNGKLGGMWRVVVTHANANAITYAITAEMLV